jgi:hypothetical protein
MGPGSRAYVIVEEGALSSELAYAAGVGDLHHALCQH